MYVFSVVCVVTGGNMDNMLYARGLDRGMSAEGRLLKFRVIIYTQVCSYLRHQVTRTWEIGSLLLCK